MDGKKVGIVVAVLLLLVGSFVFYINAQEQQAKKDATIKAEMKIALQKEKDSALAKVKADKKESDRALKLQKEQEDARVAELQRVKEQENAMALELQKSKELEAKKLQEEKIAKLMRFKNSIHIFNFDSNSIVLNSGANIESFLINLDGLNEENLVQSIIISAYADNIGLQGYNMKLSAQRTKALDIKLQNYGFNIQRVANGENNPVASNKTKEGRASNRRIEIEIK